MFEKFKRKRAYQLLPCNDRDAVRFYLSDYFAADLKENLNILLMYEYKFFKGITLTIFSCKPGIIIGKEGKDINKISNYIKSNFYIKEIKIKEMFKYKNYNDIGEVH